MKSQDDNKLYTAVIRKNRHNVIIAFAITTMDFADSLARLKGSVQEEIGKGYSMTDSDMVLISQGLEIDQYEAFTNYAHNKFDHHDITTQDLQDLWVSYAKEHGFSRPEDTAYANNDGTNQHKAASPGPDTTTEANTANDASIPSLPETAKDDSHPIHDDVFVPYDLNISGIYINNAIGISNPRLEELAGPLHEIIKDEMQKGLKAGTGANIAAILSRASKLAKTHAELLYIGYLAGANIETQRDEIGSRPNSLKGVSDLIDTLGKLYDLKKKHGSDDHFSFNAMMADAARKAAQN